MTTPETAADSGTIDAEIVRLQQIEAGMPADSPDPSDAPGPAEPDSRPAAQPEAQPEPAAKPDRISAGDKVRQAIAARFKSGRGEGLDFHGDYRDPAMQYGNYSPGGHEAADPLAAGAAQEPAAAAPAADGAPAGQESPAVPARPGNLERVVVHGVEMWLTPDQIRAEAQKSLAAGTILETAKEIKDAVSRSAVSRPHQDGYDPRSPAPEPPVDPNQGPDRYELLVHDLQFGDPTQAKDRLRQTIAADARAAAQEAMSQGRFDTERSHRIRTLAEFQAANADLASDPYAPNVITSEVNRQYVADLVAIGIPAEQIPKTASDIADWHMQARVQGRPVRDIADIFETSKTRFLEWRGGGTPAPAPAPGQQPQPAPARSTAPRVDLSADRTQRRASVPVQPTSASVPPRQPAAPQPGGDRTSAVMAMRKARGQPVG